MTLGQTKCYPAGFGRSWSAVRWALELFLKFASMADGTGEREIASKMPGGPGSIPRKCVASDGRYSVTGFELLPARTDLLLERRFVRSSQMEGSLAVRSIRPVCNEAGSFDNLSFGKAEVNGGIATLSERAVPALQVFCPSDL